MNAFVSAVNAAAAAWWPLVVHVSWQASLLAVLLLAVVWLGRRWPSPLRYWLLVLALVKFALPPLASLPTGLFSRVGPVVDEAPAAVAAAAPAVSVPLGVAESAPVLVAAEEALPITNSLPVVAAAAVETLTASVTLDGKAWLMLAHLLGAGLMAGWTLLELGVVHGLVRRAKEVREGEVRQCFVKVCGALGVRRRPRLLVSAEVPGPAAFGVL